MKRIYTILFAAATLFTACVEFQPVFTGKYENPEAQYIYTDEDFIGSEIKAFTEISVLKDMYENKPTKIDKKWKEKDENGQEKYIPKYGRKCIIKGQVTTSDQVGNLYKSLYIQDETAGIEVKIGKNGLYNEYKLGQWIYVDCTDLTVGDYKGTINLGYEDPTNE